MSGAVLQFTPEIHEYRVNGRVVPSVTQILKAVGVSTDFEGLRETSDWLAQRIDYRRDLGTAVHGDTHAFDDDDLDWGTVDPRVAPFVRAWATFRENTGLVPLGRERKLYSPTLGVCGTTDGVFYRPHEAGRLILADLKIGDPESAGARYQTAGYELLWTETNPDQPIAERWSVQLTPDRTIPYRVENYSALPDAWQDGAKFRAFVTTYFCQAERRSR